MAVSRASTGQTLFPLLQNLTRIIKQDGGEIEIQDDFELTEIIVSGTFEMNGDSETSVKEQLKWKLNQQIAYQQEEIARLSQ